MEMSKMAGRQPAFPTKYNAGGGVLRTEDAPRGLTKREYFAGLALQGLLANETFMKNTGGGAHVNCPESQSVAEAAQLAIHGADALLAVLSKGSES